HPASRRRSYLWLQAGERLPGEDFHLSDGARSQAHGTHRFQRAGSARGGLKRKEPAAKAGTLEAMRTQES
ncbi:MAG: hypothetical protein AB7U82_33155, partial [Blastocatellales bacterium]